MFSFGVIACDWRHAYLKLFRYVYQHLDSNVIDNGRNVFLCALHPGQHGLPKLFVYSVETTPDPGCVSKEHID